VRYTGRASGDALGQMTQAEQVGFTGTGPQTEIEGRWGDYSDLTVDPGDNCTFWYTQEYLAEDIVAIGTWRTRVVSFKFPAVAGSSIERPRRLDGRRGRSIACCVGA
jgi:hypothetical protein